MTDRSDGTEPAAPVHEPSSSGGAAVGDEEFAVLLTALHPRLVAFAARRSRDHGLGEDIAQEALSRAWRNRATIALDRPLWPWLQTVARNLCHDHFRRRHPLPVGRVAEAPLPAADAAAGFDELLAQRQLLASALDRLPSRQRTAVILRDVHGYGPTEAARMLGVSVHGGEQLLYRAHQRLRRAYQQLDPERRPPALLVIWPAAAQLWRRGREGVHSSVQLANQGIAQSAGACLTALALTAMGLGMTVPATPAAPPSAAADPPQLRVSASWSDPGSSTPADPAAPVRLDTTSPSDHPVAAELPSSPFAAADEPASSSPKPLDPVTDVTGPPRGHTGIGSKDGDDPDLVVEVHNPATSEPAAEEVYLGSVHQAEGCVEGDQDTCSGRRSDDAAEQHDTHTISVHVGDEPTGEDR